MLKLRDRIQRYDYLCSGTLVKRTKLCGKPSCRCAKDPSARHGPYYEWGFMQDGRQVHRMVTPKQGALLRRAIANYRAVRRILRDWEAQTARAIGIRDPPNQRQ